MKSPCFALISVPNGQKLLMINFLTILIHFRPKSAKKIRLLKILVILDPTKHNFRDFRCSRKVEQKLYFLPDCLGFSTKMLRKRSFINLKSYKGEICIVKDPKEHSSEIRLTFENDAKPPKIAILRIRPRDEQFQSKSKNFEN